jgi:DNA helicase HerA-like ATPase
VSNNSIGRVIGETNTRNFQFTVEEGEEPAVFEYVKISIQDKVDGEKKPQQVLAQVTDIQRRNPAMEGGTPIEAVETMTEQGIDNTNTVARAQVIGYMGRTGVTKPRYAPKPGTEVEIAPDSFLEKFTTVEDGLEVGTMLTRESVPAELDVSGLNRHLAILAATGAGKSHTAGVLIEELLEKGASMLAIDPHGDYVKMSQEKNEGFEHTDKIRVFKARNPGSDEYQIKVKTSKLGWRKLSELAGIREDFTNQRKIMRNAVNHIKQEKGENYAYSLEDIIDTLEKIQDDLILLDGDEENKTETVEHAEKVQFKVERLESYGIFGTTEVNFDSLLSPQQLTVLDLSGIPFKAQDLISELVLERIYQARVRHSLGESGETYNYPVFTIVEEAHRLCPSSSSRSESGPRTKEKLSEIASEGRKFGTFLTLITQRPSKIDEDVLSQCNSMIVQRIVNQQDQQSIAAASESMANDMINELPGLNVGDAIITGPAVKVPSTVHIRERKTEHGGDDIDISRSLTEAREDAEENAKTTDRLGEEDSLDL